MASKQALYDVQAVYDSVSLNLSDIATHMDDINDHRVDKAIDNLVLAKFWLGEYLDWIRGVTLSSSGGLLRQSDQLQRDDGQLISGGTTTQDTAF